MFRQGATDDEMFHENRLFLSDSMDPIDGLLFDSRVPPAVHLPDFMSIGSFRSTSYRKKATHHKDMISISQLGNLVVSVSFSLSESSNVRSVPRLQLSN